MEWWAAALTARSRYFGQRDIDGVIAAPVYPLDRLEAAVVPTPRH